MSQNICGYASLDSQVSDSKETFENINTESSPSFRRPHQCNSFLPTGNNVKKIKLILYTFIKNNKYRIKDINHHSFVFILFLFLFYFDFDFDFGSDSDSDSGQLP